MICTLKKIDSLFAGFYAKARELLPAVVRHLLPDWTLVSFGLSSCLCLLIDKCVFTAVCLPLVGQSGRAGAVAVGVAVARLVSGHCNYFYNQSVVFRHPLTGRSYIQYWGLVLTNVTISLAITEFAVDALDARGLAITLVNFCADVTLFAFSYAMQKFVVFRKNAERRS